MTFQNIPIAHVFLDIDEIADMALQFQENGDERFIDNLLAMSSSSAGDYSKIMLIEDGEDWVVRFSSRVCAKNLVIYSDSLKKI